MTEQLAIAIVFDDMDNEIKTLESRLDQNRAIKQDLMQQLRSSSNRLPILDVPSNEGTVR